MFVKYSSAKETVFVPFEESVAFCLKVILPVYRGNCFAAQASPKQALRQVI